MRRRTTEVIRAVAPEPRCVINLIDESGSAPQWDREQIQAVVEAAIAEDGLKACALTVLIVGDAGSAELHRTHFSDPDPTDVMTFPDGSPDPETGRTHLGDLAVCIDVARRAAADRKRSESAELTLYVLHGVLHLLGYDDVDPRDQLAMWQVQQRLLATVGIELEAEPS